MAIDLRLQSVFFPSMLSIPRISAHGCRVDVVVVVVDGSLLVLWLLME